MHRIPREELSEAQLKEALATCAKEPIHIPGSVQPHGFLLVTDPATQTILQASNNLPVFLGKAAEDVVGKKIADIFDADSAATLLNATTKSALEPLDSSTVIINGKKFDAVANRSNNKTLLEFEPQPDDKAYTSDKFYYDQLRYFAIGVREAKTVESLYDLIVNEIFKLTGIDRVKLYRFDKDWNGEVVAEAKKDYMPSYLGLHFPASDIPEQARKLYTKSYLRIIPDISYQPSAIVPTVSPDGEHLDLSQSILRSVSPVHIQYLDNMRIRASMSISIIQNGKLWGLVACHHNSPLYIPYRTRMVAEVIGHTFSAQLSSLQEIEKSTEEQKRILLIERLSAALKENPTLNTLFMTIAPLSMDALKSSGVALHSNGQTFIFGETPKPNELAALFAWIKSKNIQDLLYTDDAQSILDGVPQLEHIDGGMLIVKVSLVTSEYAIWFRPNIQKEVSWAGNPEKPAEDTKAGYRLTPRGSFELWKEISKGRSQPWSHEDIRTAEDIVKLFVESKQVTADQANVAKSEFMATLSHELRTPMNVIMGISDILVNSQQLTDKQRMLLNTLKGSADSLLSLINDMLDVAKIESGNIELENIEFSLPRLTQEVLSMMSVRAMEKGIKLDLIKRNDFPTSFCGDPNRIRQVLLNLVNNAVKFTEQGDVTITYGLAKTDDNLYSVTFDITDTGIGIPPNKLDTIFEKFTQADSSISRRFGGTGLGLSITKTLVELLGGHITVKSVVGVGSTFAFTIPLATEGCGLVKDVEVEDELDLQTDSPRIPKVLVVEDVDANAMVVCTYLEEFGYEYDRVYDGKQAVEAAQKQDYLAILMDVQMHGMNGFVATGEIRKLEQAGTIQNHNYIIGMTAHALAGDRERCYAEGMDDYIPKPFNPKELRQKILSAIFSRRE